MRITACLSGLTPCQPILLSLSLTVTPATNQPLLFSLAVKDFKVCMNVYFIRGSFLRVNMRLTWMAARYIATTTLPQPKRVILILLACSTTHARTRMRDQIRGTARRSRLGGTVWCGGESWRGKKMMNIFSLQWQWLYGMQAMWLLWTQTTRLQVKRCSWRL